MATSPTYRAGLHFPIVATNYPRIAVSPYMICTPENLLLFYIFQISSRNRMIHSPAAESVAGGARRQNRHTNGFSTSYNRMLCSNATVAASHTLHVMCWPIMEGSMAASRVAREHG